MQAIIPVAIGAVAIGALESHRSGALRTVIGQKPTEGATRALAALSAVAGVAPPVASSGSALDTFKAQQAALVRARGSVTSGLAYDYPRMRVADLRELVASWFDAFEAGRDASTDTQRDFALVRDPGGIAGWGYSLAASEREWRNARSGQAPEYADEHTDLGRYLFALTSWTSRTLPPSEWAGSDEDASMGNGADDASQREATAAEVVGTFDRLRWFIGGIEGVSYVFPWARPSEQDPIRHVPGAVGAAAAASAGFVADVAGEALGLAGQLLASVLKDPLLWVGGALLVGGVVYLGVKHAG